MLSDVSSETHTLELWLDALAGIGAAVGSDEPVADLLNRVAHTACTLLTYDFCAVFLPDASGRALSIVGAHGLSPDYIAKVNAERPILLDVRGADEAPTSVAFRTAQVVALEDIERDAGIGPWGGVAQEQGYRALVSVPLRRSGAVVGALNGYRKNPHRFDHAEVSLVTTLATQVAIALGTAQLRAREQETIRELRRSEEVHTLLTATALRGEGVAGVAMALAELLGRGVLIDDVYGETLAQSDWKSTDPDEFGPSTDVILDGDAVASIHVDAASDVLSAIDIRAVEQAAVVCALELLRARTAAEVEQRLRGSLVADLLDAEVLDSDGLLDRARRLGWDLSGEQLLISLRCTGSQQVAGLISERMRVSAERLAASMPPRPLVAVHRGDVVLVCAADAHSRDATALANRLVETLEPHSDRAVAAIGQPTTVAGLPDVYRTLTGALTLAVGGPSSTVVDLRDLEIEHLLLQLDNPARLTDFAASVLGPAVRYDADHQTELLRTARVLLDNDLDRQAAATELHLHPNTVAQRIRRLETLVGLRLAKPRDLLRLTSALSVAHIVGMG